MTKLTLSEWTAEGVRRFGAGRPWRYRCPCCGRTFTGGLREASQIVPSKDYALFDPFREEMISVGGVMCFPFAEAEGAESAPPDDCGTGQGGED